jgi:hypothetical protein
VICIPKLCPATSCVRGFVNLSKSDASRKRQESSANPPHKCFFDSTGPLRCRRRSWGRGSRAEPRAGGPDWAREIKEGAYRLQGRREGDAVRR